MKTPSAMSETDRVRDQLHEDRSVRVQETLRAPGAPPRASAGDRPETVPGAWKEAVEFWDNTLL